MPIATNYVKVDGLHIALIPNVPQEQGGERRLYVPLTIRVTGMVRTPEGAIRAHQVEQTMGTARLEPLTPRELYQAAPALVKPLLKRFILEAVGEDVSGT